MPRSCTAGRPTGRPGTGARPTTRWRPASRARRPGRGARSSASSSSANTTSVLGVPSRSTRRRRSWVAAAVSSTTAPAVRAAPCSSSIVTTRSATTAASSRSWVTISVVVAGRPQDPGQLDGQAVVELAVEAGQRFVEQQRARRRGERPGEGDPLGLAAAEVGDLAAAEAGEPDEVEHLGDPRVALGRRDAAACAARRRRWRRRRGGGTAARPGTPCRCRAGGSGAG